MAVCRSRQHRTEFACRHGSITWNMPRPGGNSSNSIRFDRSIRILSTIRFLGLLRQLRWIESNFDCPKMKTPCKTFSFRLIRSKLNKTFSFRPNRSKLNSIEKNNQRNSIFFSLKRGLMWEQQQQYNKPANHINCKRALLVVWDQPLWDFF